MVGYTYNCASHIGIEDGGGGGGWKDGGVLYEEVAAEERERGGAEVGKRVGVVAGLVGWLQRAADGGDVCTRGRA